MGGFLVALLRAFVEEHDLGRVLAGFLMKTGPHLAGRVPDLLYVAREHEPRIRRNHLEGPADLVVEIVSAESTTRDREVKRREYELGGVREFWLVDPLEGRATFFVLEEGRYHPKPLESDGTLRSHILPGLWLRPEWLLAEPRPKIVDVLRRWGLA